MKKLDVKCDEELQDIISHSINNISDELRAISIDVSLVYLILKNSSSKQIYTAS